MSFVLAFGLGLILTPLAIVAGSALRLVDRPSPALAADNAGSGGLKIHDRPISALGGAAVVGSTLIALVALGDPPRIAITMCVLLALLVGLVDDATGLPPWARTVLLGAAGVGLALGGVRIDALGPLAFPAVVVVALACTNSLNLVDGQDGLAGGLGLVAALSLASLGPAGADGSWPLGMALGGSLLAFLLWNRPPARIFLGNSGAYAVGLLVALLGAAAAHDWRGLLAAGLCLGVLAFEVVTTVLRRIGARATILGGDRRHSYDVLAEQLRSRPRSTVVVLAHGIGLAALAAAVRLLPLALGVVVAAAAVVFGAWAATRLWPRDLRPRMRSIVREGPR
jgi:UDP-GlcNAc:undecaprenyl-phosphate GlcNAc-1-phosphate transferase